jgi:hypothetical protein
MPVPGDGAKEQLHEFMPMPPDPRRGAKVDFRTDQYIYIWFAAKAGNSCAATAAAVFPFPIQIARSQRP